MSRFDPFAPINARHGAPFGRRNVGGPYDGRSRLYVRLAGGDGYYDRGGAYWGHSSRGVIFAVWTRGGSMVRYVRAKGVAEAIRAVQEEASQCSAS